MPIIGVNDPQERLISQRCSLGHAEDAMIFLGPGKDIAANVHPPTADLPYLLSAVQVLPDLLPLPPRLCLRAVIQVRTH